MTKLYLFDSLKSKISILLLVLFCWTRSYAQVTFSESFDGTTFPNTGWTVSGSYPGSLFRATSGVNPAQAPHTGAGELEWGSYSAPSGATEDLITPVIDWSNRGANTPTVSFWFYRDAVGYNTAGYDGEGVNVWVNTSASLGGTQLGFVPRRGGQAASGTYLQTGATYTTAVNGWYQYTFNVPAGFNTATNYIIYDFVSKYGDNTFMDDEQYVAYPPTPCTPTYSNLCGTSNDFIDNFSFGALSNLASGCNGNSNNYIYYSAPANVVQQGGSYNLSIQSGPAWAEGFGVWIDYNHSGILSASEQVYASPGASTSPYTGTVSIPLTAPTGLTFMRARCNYAAVVPASDFCSNYAYGETEDYDITVIPPVITFSLSTSNSCTNFPVTITNTTNNASAYTYIWSFGDGGLTNIQPTSFTHTYTYPGNYTISVSVYDGGGNYMGSASSAITIQQGSSGNFYMSKTSICPGDNVYFDSNGNPSPYNWKISDGYTNSTSNFTRTFNTPGTFTVSLIVPTPCGNDTIRQTLNVTPTIQPNAAFTSSLNSACPNKAINFSPSDYSGTHLWNFGDGKTSSQVYPVHQYTTTGTYTVTHSLTNLLCNNTQSVTATISIVNTIFPTTANFNFTPNDPLCPGIQITFNSNDYDGAWKWNFGDASTSTAQNPKHTYPAPGNYVVTHTVTNTCNNSLTTSYTVAVTNTIVPTSTFNFSPDPTCPNDLISFNPNQTDGKSYLWNFGDGATSTLEYPSHKYATVSNYTVTHTITNYCNNSSSTSSVAHVVGNIYVQVFGGMGVYNVPACPNEPLNYYISANGVKYIWNYGDGKTDTLASANGGNTSHSYSVAGTYTASVKISNNCNKDTTVYQAITIKSSIAFPAVSLYSYPTSDICPGQLISFNGPWGYPTYKWTMGDGTPQITSSNAYFNYSYSAVGTYIASLRVTNYCGSDTVLYDTIKVQNSLYFPAIGLSLSSGTPSCPNQNVSFYTSSGFASYKWYFGDGTTLTTSNYNVNHSYTAAATYNYSVTITNFCGNDTTINAQAFIDNTLQPSSWLGLYINPNIVCAGQEVQYQSDQGYATYLWDFGDGYSANGTWNVTHTYTGNGTYNVNVTVTNSCGNSNSTQNTVQVSPTASFPPGMSMSTNPSSVCPNEPITLQTYGGYSSYMWDFGDGGTATTVGPLVSHSYSVVGAYGTSVKVSNTCGNQVTLYTTATVQNNNTITGLNIYLPYDPSCPGDAVILNVSTGTGTSNYSYLWNFGDGSPTATTIGTGTSHSYTATGVYNVVLTATNSCGKSATTSKLVTINNTAFPSLNPWQFGILPGNSYGQVSVCPNDVLVFYFEGINPNNLWDFGDGTTAVATDVFVKADGTSITTIKHAYNSLGIKTYSLKLTNHCNKSTTLNNTLNVANNMLVSGGFIVSPPSGTLGYTTCGLINFVAYGGKQYSWDFGDGAVLSTISPTVGHAYTNSGNYTVKVIVTNGCGNSATYSQTFLINGIGGTSLTPAALVNPTCNGGTNGSASVNVSGGQAPYSYSWSNSLGQPISTNVSASNLSAGAYNISVTDNNGCAGTATVVLNNPVAISFTTSTTPSACGGSTGSATVAAVASGTSPYTYSWANGQTTATATGLSLGGYAVVVRDVNSCSTTSNVSVSENGTTLSVSSTTSVTCNGSSTGAANIGVSGGTPPYTFAWSNGATTQNISGIVAGNYSVVVTDNGGCQSTINTNVAQPAVILVNAVTVIAPTCGNFDGSAMANVSGGTSPYTYLWPNAGNKTTQTVTGLPAGNYSVTVTDSHGCTKAGTVTLSNSNAPNVVSVVANVSCSGAADGSVNLTVTGGTSPYLYTWNVGPPQTNFEDISGLVPGSYFVSIQDAAGCLSFRLFTITQPAVLSATVTSTPATCGNNDGTASATISGGNTPYTYSWTGGQTTQTAVGLSLGSKTVTVTDNKGCVTSATTTITATAFSINICEVTVDNTSTKNVIVWDKPIATNIDSFRVYRYINSAYTRIGGVNYPDSSKFIDITNGVDPNITSYKYKITVLDNCGNESVLSAFHQTIHLQASLALPPNSFNLNWNDYLGFPFTQYYVMIDSMNNGNWYKRDSVSFGNPLTWTDTHTYPGQVNYRIDVAQPNGCTVSIIKDPQVMASNLNLSKSNINRILDTTVVNTQNFINEMLIDLYPNPNSGVFTIRMPHNSSAVIKVFNVLGEEVQRLDHSGIKSNITVDLRSESKGVYYVQVTSVKGTATKKIIIE